MAALAYDQLGLLTCDLPRKWHMGHVLFEYRHDGLWECEEETAAAVVIRSIGVEFWYRHFGMCRFFLTARWSRGISFVQICSSLLGGEAGFLKREGHSDLEYRPTLVEISESSNHGSCQS
jgi:hypothetical protein